MLVDTDHVVADIVVAAELAVDMAAVDIEVVAGIVQRQDVDKRSSYVDY